MTMLVALDAAPATHPAGTGDAEVGRTDRGTSDTLLKAIFKALDNANIRYCVLHGYDAFDRPNCSDVDAVIDPKITSDEFSAIVDAVCAKREAQVALRDGYHLVVTERPADKRWTFLTLDFDTVVRFGGLHFYTAEEILSSRRRRGDFWIPATHLGFAAYLARSIARRSLDSNRIRALSAGFNEDPGRCRNELARFWPVDSVQLIAASAASGDWSQVLRASTRLRRLLHWQVFARAWPYYLRWLLAKNKARLMRLLRPQGVHLVLLGPDGAGKSSVERELKSALSSVFPRIECYGFVPAWIQNLLHGADRPTDTPHLLEERSPLFSVARALLYWLPANLLGYIGVRLQLSRGALIINDRHFVDALVDQKRYRFGGPVWLLKRVWAMIPKPDVVILLDASPDVLYARKQELPLEELANLRCRYLELVQSLSYGKIVNVQRPLEEVAQQLIETILDCARRRQRASSSPKA